MKFCFLPAKTPKIASLVFVALTLGLGCKPLVRALFYPPQVDMLTPALVDQRGASFDHTLFNSLLSQHVNTQGLVHYAGFRKDAEQFDTYLNALSAAEVKGLASAEAMAFYINAYNAFTIKLILDYPQIASIRDIPEAKRWKHRRWKIGAATVSLDDIEHQILRKRFRENRIHFALVCAAKSCPPLRREAYTGAKLSRQLDEQAKIFFASADNFRHDAEKNTIYVSSILDWFAGDFGGKQKLPAYISRFAPKTVTGTFSGTEQIEFLNYDWNLNKR